MESSWTKDCKPPFGVVVTKPQRGTRFLTSKNIFISRNVYHLIRWLNWNIYPQWNGLHILNSCIPSVIQVDEDNGVDWKGPHTPCASYVSVPEIQLLRPLSERKLPALPNSNVPFSQALAVYLEILRPWKTYWTQNLQVKHCFHLEI